MSGHASTRPFAAIFDLDGTLVDSYDAHLVAWQRMSERYGVPITREHFQRHFGRRNDAMLREIWQEAGRDPLSDEDVARLGAEKESRYRELVHSAFPVMDGARDLLDSLKSDGWRLAVGSSAPIENVDLAIDGMDARSHFSAVVTGDDVTRGKPDPQCFLLAAERLGVSPDRCIVVEDAPAGIAAALAARMRCVAISSKGHDPRTQRDAHHLVTSLRDVTPTVMRGLLD